MTRAVTGDTTPIPQLIGRKRDGGELRPQEIRGLMERYLRGEMGDEQMAALLMAGVIRGFTAAEAVALTEVMVASGDTIDLSALRGPTVDKHSTGGVGDTTTLVVGPLLAAAGMQTAKLSGRGLGHTGGTLDKLESIPGLRVDLSPRELLDQVERVGLAVAAASAELVPADKRLYALRDVTGTVGSPALIAASVMSKKLAGGAEHILLDVKVGDGAFMPTDAAAGDLAQLCVEIGVAHGRRTGALVTDMSQPLGPAVGNALEVGIAVETLQGLRRGRLGDVCVEVAAATVALTGRDLDAARQEVERHLASGRALEVFREFVTAQGGDPAVADRPWEILERAPVVRDWTAPAGYLEGLSCRGIGELAGELGAGRQRQGDPVDAAVGLELLAAVGDRIDEGRPVIRVHARAEGAASEIVRRLPQLVAVAQDRVAPPRLVRRRVGLESLP